MSSTYLKKYYFDDHKLAQRARLEFFRSLASGRMIAFVGSMATQAFGYGSWPQLRMIYSAIATSSINEIETLKGSSATDSDRKRWDWMRERIAKFEQHSAASRWTPTVGMSLIDEVLDRWSEAVPDGCSEGPWSADEVSNLRQLMRVKLAKHFRQPAVDWRMDRRSLRAGFSKEPEPSFEEYFDVPKALWARLNIRRFATTNYDFELERVVMLGDGPAQAGSKGAFEELRKLRSLTGENFSWDLGGGRIRRVMADGWATESDVLNRERIDRMIEFAVGTDDVDGHILHLHGRACNWRSMIVSLSDYDSQYRLNDLNRAPFEFAKRLMFGGNPILFIGLGMSEAELNLELQEFISNNPYQRMAPTFLLWSAAPENMTPEKREAKRLDLLRRLGVLVMYDTDFSGAEPKESDRPAGYKLLNQRYGIAAEKLLARGPGEAAFTDDDLGTDDEGKAYVTRRVTQERLAGISFEADDFSNDFDLKTLRASVELLRPNPEGNAPDPFIDPTIREMTIGARWRSMYGRVSRADDAKEKAVVLWDVLHKDGGRFMTGHNLVEIAKSPEMVCIIGAQGCGKGHAARTLANIDPSDLGIATASHCLLINGGFSFDTDTLLDGVARFLDRRLELEEGKSLEEDAVGQEDPRPRQSRAKFFERLQLAGRSGARKKRVLIIMNGMERFFDLEGNPLSAELDQLLNALSHKPNGAPRGKGKAKRSSKPRRVGVVMFGTERVRSYMEALGVRTVDFDDVAPAPEPSTAKIDLPGWYLGTLWEQAKIRGLSMSPDLASARDRYQAMSSGRISGDSIDLRRALFRTIFDDRSLAVLLAKPGDDPNWDLVDPARKLLRALAFIGIPTEKEVLGLMPGFDDPNGIDEALQALHEASLVLRLDGYRSSQDQVCTDRFALHRSLLTELRYRYGIPLSEAKLSTAFNMSLFVAQPADGDIPDTDIHDQLGAAIDRLIRSYREADQSVDHETEANVQALGISPDEYDEVRSAAARACGSSDRGHADGLRSQEALAATQRLCARRHVLALRTALALVRSYYSTTGLLTLDSGDRLIAPGRHGVLLEHAERLDDLIDGYGKVTLARESLRKSFTALLGDNGEGFIKVFGDVEPFYPDELVWLHNERGVVRLAMGDLYEARRSFVQALKINRGWVERSDRGHNWRRVQLNNLIVDIERGRIGFAQRRCEELLGLPAKRGFRLREDDLAEAIVLGCQAWCMQLKGRHDQAIPLFEQACKRLSKLNEVRAQAYFERLRADAMGSAKSLPAVRRVVIEQALNLALSTKQMDLVHRLRVTLADNILFGEEQASERRKQQAHRHLEDALAYALHADVHRVRCEASTTTARARLQMSDYEGALRFATDAMMIATRYGMELRKISIRALIAKIMAARGHPVTAEHLARTCIKMATRRSFQTAIDKASKVLTDIPQISAAIRVSDHSGRRHF